MEKWWIGCKCRGDRSFSKGFECCGRFLKIFEKDIIYEIDGLTEIYMFRCAICGQLTEIDAAKIPSDIKSRLFKEKFVFLNNILEK